MASLWREHAAAQAWAAVQARLQEIDQAEKLARYELDPVGFGRDVLGETFTRDIERVMHSVVENPVTIARSCTGPGKTHGAARLAVWFYKVYPDAKVFVTAAPPFENLKKLLWGEIAACTTKHPELFNGHAVRSLEIARPTSRLFPESSFITGVTIPTTGTVEERQAKFSGKHAPHLFFIVDEGDAVPEEVYAGIEGCMSGGFARLLIMFNPKIAAGSVYMKEKNKRANVVHLSAFNHPNVVSGQNLIPGAVDRDITVRRINEWTLPLPDDTAESAKTFRVPDFLVGATAQALDGSFYPPLPAGLREITTPEFHYMVLGEYPAEGAQQLISQEWIDNARARYDAYVAKNGTRPPEYVQPILGLDVAELGGDFNAACLRYGGFVPPMTLWNGVDVDATSVRAYTLYREKNALIAQVDGTGIGASVAPAMVRQGRADNLDVRAVSVKLAESPSHLIKSDLGEFFQLRDQLWWAVREWLRTDPGAMLPPDPYLLDELRAVSYEKRDNGKIRMTPKEKLRDLLRRSPDRADALCLTFSPYARPTILRLGD
jgi:hypothetical protein